METAVYIGKWGVRLCLQPRVWEMEAVHRASSRGHRASFSGFPQGGLI